MIFVTGGTGLVGSYLIQQLSKTGRKIKVLIRNEKDKSSLEHLNNIIFVKGDILDPMFLNEETKGVEYIFHAAGIVSFSPFDKEIISKVNVEGTANVVNAGLLNDVKKLCHLSSIASLGKPKHNNILNENSSWEESDTNSHYGKSKYLAELEVWRGIEEGLDAVIVNPSVILGGGDWNKSSTRLFKYAYSQPLFYTSKQTDFVDIRDVVNIMLALCFSDYKNERYVISANDLSYKDLLYKIAGKFNKKPPKMKAGKFLAAFAWRFEHIKALLFKTNPLITKETSKIASNNFKYSNTKIKTLLNYKFHTIDETIDWICDSLSTKYHLNS